MQWAQFGTFCRELRPLFLLQLIKPNGRTDKPQGKQYEFQPKVIEDSAEMRQFIDMCFDPNSPMNDRLKQTLIEMLGEAKR